MNPWMTIKTKMFTHRPRALLALSWLCWWCHKRLLKTSQWPYNFDMITWIMVSNSIYISILFTAIFTAARVNIYTTPDTDGFKHRIINRMYHIAIKRPSFINNFSRHSNILYGPRMKTVTANIEFDIPYVAPYKLLLLITNTSENLFTKSLCTGCNQINGTGTLFNVND